MQAKTLKKLEFNKIVDKLATLCTFQVSRERAEELVPFDSLEQAILGLRETSESKEILRFYPTLPLGGLRDIRSLLRKVEIGGFLQPTELLDIAGTLKSGRRLKKFILELNQHYPRLKESAQLVSEFRDLETKIANCIGEDGTVLDTASQELAVIRRQIKSLQVRIKERLEHFIRSSEHQKMLQDPIITLRDGRYVIPVKQEYRSQVQGIVHDQSSSGATLFIEPIAVVEMDNELRGYVAKEALEVERILRELTRAVELRLSEVKYTLEALASIDLIFAKGKLSAQMDAGEPKLNNNGIVDIYKGRHPLIQGKPVPVSISMGKSFDTLVITGPNTGGKTVTLKTVGLFCLMAQAGLHVPAEAETELSIFEYIFADIGDEQSIEQSLSTFSSHMTNIVGILEQVNYNSLVLMDEVGAGTDPTEGAALAMAILQYLQGRGAKTIATTHYSELKSFAYNNSRVENASVEFDIATLRPTYRLLIGTPGRSNAFEIAGRLGLNEEVVNLARGYLTEREVQVADLLQNLEETQRATEDDREEAAKVRSELESLRAKLEDERLQQANRERAIIERASREATEIVKKAKQEAEEIISGLKELMHEEKGKFHRANEAREKLKKIGQEAGDMAVKNQPIAPGQPLTKVKPGQQVDIPKFKQKGYVLSEPNANSEVLVQIGIMKMYLKLEELRFVAEPKKEVHSTGAGKLAKGKTEEITREVDLRGLTVDEALYQVDKYLDDAMLTGLAQVNLIHGKGTGALRSAITDYLNGHPHVKSFRLGQHGEGGYGVTVVEL
ncbi:MAG TPA: endonuclease MutS2, partial [Candidatus Deferrimicrobium sp.]|nr:endonuclease MutS2 [Candidatus Deferrimicrobium sp.]